MLPESAAPHYLLREAAVDGVDVLLQNRTGLSLDLLHFLQPPAGDEQAPGLTVVRQHLWMQDKNETRDPWRHFWEQ